MVNQVFPQQWLSLSHDTRVRLATEFGLTKSSHPEVIQDTAGIRLVSDGYTALDLMGITLAKLQKLTNSESSDFYGLFSLAAEGKKLEEPVVSEAVAPAEPIVTDDILSEEPVKKEEPANKVRSKKFW